MTHRDIKLLWGRAGGLCSICRHPLAHDKEHATGAFHLGEHAHIVAEEPTGPRGNSILTAEEREAYPNRVLLCPTCHTLIDTGNPEAYPVERLHCIKTEHELWVQSRLSAATEREEADAQIYASLIDATVTGADLEHWNTWVSNGLSPHQVWEAGAPERIQAYREHVLRAVWPGTLPELEAALQTLSMALHQAKDRFLKHATPRTQSEELTADRFYRIGDWDPATHQKLVDRFERWQRQCDDWLFEATKAANWLADVVRRDINPMCFATEGCFSVVVDRGSTWVPMVLTYSAEERGKQPKALLDRVRRELRANKRSGT